MKQHKWHKEIKAWADGAEIESAWFDDPYQWFLDKNPDWSDEMLYRIKPQPKEPQYLYVYYRGNGEYKFESVNAHWNGLLPIGKIKLEDTENE